MMLREVASWFALALIFSIPWENAIVLPGIGSGARLVGLLAAGFWGVTAILTAQLRKPHPFHLAIYLFLFRSE